MENDKVGIEDTSKDNNPSQEPTSAAVEEYLRLTGGSCHLGTGKEGAENNVAVFKGIKVWGIEAGLTYQDSIASHLAWPARLVHSLLSHKKDSKKVILHGIDGVVREGEMLIMLGKPGSGCTTLLKTLAGMTESFHGWSGIIKYLGISVNDIKKRFRGDVVYNAEGDVHFPYLTVLNTLGFAVETKTPGSGMKQDQRHGKVRDLRDSLLKVFGMEETRSTLVGNEFVAGVSGGERKRVSLAEVLSTNAKVSLWDNSTQGLDASTSIRFGKSLQVYTKSGKNIAIAALYQASDDLLRLFDKVTLLSEGQQIFFGTITDAQDHLMSLGFIWPERQSMSEFFIAVTDRDLRVTKEGWEDRVPRSVDDFVKCWKDSIYYRRLQEDLGNHLERTDRDGRPVHHLASHGQGSSYILSWPAQLAITLHRAADRLLGDRAFLAGSIVMPVFVSLIFGSAFYNTPDNTQGFFSRQGVIFFGILFNTIQTIGEVATQYAQRPVVQKQSGFAMYHPGIDALSSLISTWPLKLISVSLFGTDLYFLSNLKREPGAFFTFLLFTYTTVLLMGSMFRLIAAVNKNESTAISIAGVLILPMVLYTGYIIPPTSMHPWFKWISYINPLSYSFESLVANEFHNRYVPCARLIPSGPLYPSISLKNQVCPVTGSTPGTNLVSGDRYIEASFNYHYSHLWRNYGILIAYLMFFFSLYGLAVEFVPQVAKGKGDILIFLRRNKKRDENVGVTRSQQHDEHASRAPESAPPNEKEPGGFGKLTRSQDTFTWDNIEYEIPVRGGTKTLLTGIHGYVKPGSMTALLGESGAGKTTLLNVLARRTHTGVVRGDILINGLELGDNFPRRTGYVESQDVHLSQFTVRETLRFSAQLRQPQHVSNKEKNEYVEEIIDALEMSEYAEAVVGVPGSGLSLEQRKRMTVGVELVAKPSLLFLDEPTSGLGSQSSWSIIGCLRKLADSGQAILCTIHQPSSSLFEQFDRILLLEKGGLCVYFGDIGENSSALIRYFESNGAGKCPKKTNPAEYILQVTETRNGETNWADTWRKSAEAGSVAEEINALCHRSSASRAKYALKQHNQTSSFESTSYLHQYQLVQSRSLLWYWRSPVYIRGKVILNVFAGLFLGFTFFKEHNSAQGLQNKMFASFAALILSAPLMNGLQPHFFEMRALYESREEPSKMFHWSIFILTIVTTEILTNILAGTLFFLPWYFAVGFMRGMTNRAARGAYQWIMFVMFETWVSTFGQLLAALAPNVQTAALLIPMTFVFVALFCGVLQPLSQLPKFWHFVHYASPFTWIVEGFFSNVLHNTTVHCTSLEINIFQPPANLTCSQFAGPFVALGIGALYNPNATSNCEYCRFSTGDQYLRLLSFDWGHRWRNFGFLFVYAGFNISLLCFVTWLPRVLRRRSQIKGRKVGGATGQVIGKGEKMATK